MSTTDNSGPAYPQPMTMDANGNFHHSAGHPDHIGGLAKRELFAMAAMQGLLANPDLSGAQGATTSKWSVQEADALLAELAK
jgi:hypothetical protein